MLYPVHLNLTGRPVLVVGGGKVASRKVATLLEYGARVSVVAPRIAPEIRRHPEVACLKEEYRPDLVTGKALVFACSDRREVNRQVAADARRAGVWCNVADDPEACDFYVPASLHRGRVTVAVSTAGASPRLAAYLRDRCGEAMPANIEEVAEELAKARATVLERMPEAASREELLQVVMSEESIRRLVSDGAGTWHQWFLSILEGGGPAGGKSGL